MADTPGFGAGFGQLIGAGIAASDLSAGLDSVNGSAGRFEANATPYNVFGQSFLNPASGAISKAADTADTGKSYDQFMADYKTSPGEKYQTEQADAVQNSSAAANGKLLSGSNLRALGSINEGISSTYANQAFGNYLSGNQQHFGQLEASLGNMFNAIGVGTTVTGQDAGVVNGQMAQQSAIAQAQAKNDASKGSGLGSMFSGLGSFAAAF